MLQGTLSQGVLPGILRELYVGRRTGILYFVNAEERRGVRFRKGNIVRADTNVTEERLGETLLRLALLSQVDLDRATDVVVREKKRLGLVLQEMAIMDKEHVEEALAVHVREILLKVFQSGEGTYHFEDQDPEAPVDEDVTLRLSTGEMILEAVRRIEDPDVVRFALGDIDRILGLSTDPLLRFQRITLTPADGYILSRIDGTFSAREILQMIPMVPEETLRSLFGLLCTGIVEFLPLPPKAMPKPLPAVGRPAVRPAAPPAATPPSATPTAPRAAPRPEAPVAAPAARAPATAVPLRPAVPVVGAAVPAGQGDVAARRKEILELYETLRTKNHFEILGLPKASSETQVKEAYFREARLFHPDVHHDPALADLKDKLEAIFIRLGEAYEVLRNTRTRSAYETDLASRTPRAPTGASSPAPPGEAGPGPDPAAEARAAEEAIKRGEKKLVEEKYWDAIQLLEPAIPRAQGKMKNRGRVLLARAYVKNPNWIRRGEELLQTVIQDDPRSLDAYWILGNIYRAGGLRSRAASMYRKILELKPDHEDALAALTDLAPEESSPPPEGGGLLKKLFGKS